MQVRNEDFATPEPALEGTVVDWMKRHTINDLEIMANELEGQGMNAREVRKLIDDLKVMNK
jgi:hypothetical protein